MLRPTFWLWLCVEARREMRTSRGRLALALNGSSATLSLSRLLSHCTAQLPRSSASESHKHSKNCPHPMSKQSDPFGRRKSFHAAPPSAHSTQALRRHQALEAQRQRRTTAIEAARTAFRDLDNLEDLSLAGSSADEADSPPPPPLAASSSSEQQRESVATDSQPTTEATPVISKTKRKAFKTKYKAWAKNLLSYAETLDLRYGLPEGIDSDWRAVVVPKGKRCLCATASEQGSLRVRSRENHGSF